jgi:hypothetical protein
MGPLFFIPHRATKCSGPALELVQKNPNDIATLSYFTMLCECWLGIAPNTSLFWYYYSPVWYDKTIFSEIELSLRHHRRKEYLDATFRGSWKGAS